MEQHTASNRIEAKIVVRAPELTPTEIDSLAADLGPAVISASRFHDAVVAYFVQKNDDDTITVGLRFVDADLEHLEEVARSIVHESFAIVNDAIQAVQEETALVGV